MLTQLRKRVTAWLLCWLKSLTISHVVTVWSNFQHFLNWNKNSPKEFTRSILKINKSSSKSSNYWSFSPSSTHLSVYSESLEVSQWHHEFRLKRSLICAHLYTANICRNPPSSWHHLHISPSQIWKFSSVCFWSKCIFCAAMMKKCEWWHIRRYFSMLTVRIFMHASIIQQINVTMWFDDDN